MSLFHASTCFEHCCAHHQEIKIVLYSLWYHHTCGCDDTRDCIIQFWPSDDEHMCSKHVQAWNKLIKKFSASSWMIIINKLVTCISATSVFLLPFFPLVHYPAHKMYFSRSSCPFLMSCISAFKSLTDLHQTQHERNATLWHSAYCLISYKW